MSDFFKDKFVSDLEGSDDGWLTLAIEPYTYSLLDKLEESGFPQEYNITYEDIEKIGIGRYGNITLNQVVSLIIKKHNITGITHEEVLALAQYRYHKPVTITNDIMMNFTDRTMQGTITFNLPEIDESKLNEFALETVKQKFYSAFHSSNADVGRLNEIMDLLECENERKSRSVSKKSTAIRNKFIRIIKDDEWRIRNCDMMLKAADWVLSAMNGNMHGLANLTKLKCMTHGGKVIYSMEEIK